MTSPFSQLFVAIQNKLATIVGTDTLPIFKTIEQDLGQLEDASRGMNRPPVNWPCVLIDIDDTNFSNESENVQLGQVHVCIRIGFPPFSSTEWNVPNNYRNKALYYYDLEQAVYIALQGWSPGVTVIDNTTSPATTVDLSDIFGYFMRTRVSKEDRNDLLRVRAIMFTLTMDDHSTETVGVLTPATISISPAINIIVGEITS